MLGMALVLVRVDRGLDVGEGMAWCGLVRKVRGGMEVRGGGKVVR